MADKKDPKDPSTTSTEYDAMLPAWTLMATVLGGTTAMRAAGQTYLPQYEMESDERYNARLNMAVLFNVTDETLDTLASKPFTEKMKLEDVPEGFEDELFPNIDLQGNNMDVFARAWFKEGLAKGWAYVLVDMPRIEPRADGQPRTLADDRAENIRPYWVLVNPENVLYIQYVIRDGKKVPVHIRILECYTERVGFAEVEKKQIRVLEPGTVEIWQPKEKKKASDKEEWVLADAWETGLKDIPWAKFLAGERPPLEDLAHLNVAHWQSTADQRSILTVARFPMLAVAGADDDQAIAVGPHQLLRTESPQGLFYYVEHTGAAIEAGTKDLEALEAQMAMYGAEFLQEQPGDETATAKAIDSADESSSLSSMALRFEDSMALALDFTAQWKKLAAGSGGSVEVVKDYEPSSLEASGLTALENARKSRDISREAYIQGLIMRGVLPEDYDAEADLELIEAETSSMLSAAAAFDLDPNAPTPGPPVPGQLPKPIVPAPPAKKPAAKKTTAAAKRLSSKKGARK